MSRYITFLFLCCAFPMVAQRDLTPNKKKDAFGTRDFRNLNSYGLQFQLGPTWTMTRSINEELDSPRGPYYHDPRGRLGVYGEIGMFHFPKRRSALSKKLKTILVSYYDWGIGFKYFRGAEDIRLDTVDAGGNVTSDIIKSSNFSYCYR